MSQEPQQQDLFEWKPEETPPPRFRDFLKSKYFWIVLLIVSNIAWFIYNSIVEFFSKYWLIIFGGLSLIITILIIWLIPKWQIKALETKKGSKDQSEFDLEKERIKLRDDTRKTMAQIIGGTFFVLGLFVTYNTFELNREGQVTERYSKAVELMGSENLSVRLGGLYALERIAKDSPKDHSTVMEILAAYIREKSKEQKEQVEKDIVIKGKEKQANKNTKEEQDKDGMLPVPTDVLAAADIINRRNQENDKKHFVFNLSGANLNSANLVGINLRDANLIGANLRDVKFRGANLHDANLNAANLSRADLSFAHLSSADLSRADLSRADLGYANLSDIYLDAEYIGGADLSFADLSFANLYGTDLTHVRNLSFEQISQAIINEKTKLSDKFEARRDELMESSRKNLEKLKSLFPKS